MNQPMKRKPGRPRKHPLPGTSLHENTVTIAAGTIESVRHLPSDAMSSLAAKTLSDPDADVREKSLAGSLLAMDDVKEENDRSSHPNLLAAIKDLATHDQDEEHVVADEAERADSGAGEDIRPESVRPDLDESGRATNGGSGVDDLRRKEFHDAQTRIQGHELAAMKEEAWQAFDYREGCGKMDTLGRIWEFAPETRAGLTVVTFSMRRPCGPRQERTISTAQYGTDTARQQSDALVDEMNGWAL